MSYTVNYNTGVDTPVSGVTTLELERSVPNFGADFRVKSDEPTEAVITNMNAPVPYPEKFRFGVSDIADVYKGTGIAATLYGPSRRGKNILCQLTEVWTATNSDDPTYTVALPVSAHIVLKIPEDPAIAVDDVLHLLGRAVSGLFDTGSETGSRLQALLRGSLLPSEL